MHYHVPMSADAPAALPASATVDEVRLLAQVQRALREENAARTVGFARALAVVCGAALFFQAFGETGRAWLQITFSVALAVLTIHSVFVARISKTPERFTPEVYRLFGISAVATSWE